MFDETDIAQERAQFHAWYGKIAATNLCKRNINARFVATRQEALRLVLEMIPSGATVAFGDSLTLHEVGVHVELRRRNLNPILDPFERDERGELVMEQEARLDLMRKAFTSDIFMAGANAITRDGRIVNVDGLGNRVAAIIFGPRKVILVAGANKIVRNVDEALRRIREVAAPLNARRHYLKHRRLQYGDLPCVRVGFCPQCNHTWSICRHTVIIEGARESEKDRIHVILVGEELGL